MIEELERMSLEQAARRLEIHPVEVIRILVRLDAFPANLRLDERDLERIRRAGGLRAFWEPGTTGEAMSLLQALLAKLLAEDLVDPAGTRADNLFRGLAAAVQPPLRRLVNHLIREGLLITRMGEQGLSVGLSKERLSELREFVETGRGVIAEVSARA